MQNAVSLTEIVDRLSGLPPAELDRIDRVLEQNRLSPGLERRFIPNPGKQTLAFNSKADILLYGGAAGGGKSSLLSGLAISRHRRTLLMRRESTQLGGLIDDTLRLYGSRKGFNGSYPQSLTTEDDRFIEFGSCQHNGDEMKWAGQPHDLLGIDEAALFLESQIRLLITWVRTIEKGLHTRVILATNPPISSEGDWLVGMFAPWLDVRHPNPAVEGELRWFITDRNNHDIEVGGPQPLEVEGQRYIPMSRTFIRAMLSDNPFNDNTEYRAKLDNLPEPYRSAFRDGNFMVARRDDLKQVIPTAWVQEAMARWTDKPPYGVPMCSIGVDVAQGGQDQTVLAPRYDGWFDKLTCVPGAKTPFGKDVAGLIVSVRRDGATIVIDMDGGWGGATFEHCVENDIEVVAFKGSGKTGARTKDRKMKFANKRAEAYWRFREALDPSQPGGSQISLPNDPELMTDLTAARIIDEERIDIQLEDKGDIKKRIGRSPDKGDAVVMSYSHGTKQANIQNGWAGYQARKNPQIVLGHQNQRRR